MGTSLHTTTNAEGEYLVAAIPPGVYDLAVVATGFNRFETKGIVLRVAQRARVDATMVVGEVKTAVTVVGSRCAQVETQSSEVSGTVTGKQISQLILNGRNFTQLVTLDSRSEQPDAARMKARLVSTATSISASMAAAPSTTTGKSTAATTWITAATNAERLSQPRCHRRIQGADVQLWRPVRAQRIWDHSRSKPNRAPKISTGMPTNLSATTEFNAQNYFDIRRCRRTSYKKNDFGYTIGGPVFIPRVYNKNKEKTFFFWCQEWRRERLPQTFNARCLTVLQRTGNFSRSLSGGWLRIARTDPGAGESA